jgi:curved DNA-binding protein
MNQNSYVDYYEDLQVSPNADLETIERVYRLLAKRYHPDNSLTGNSERFNIITSAYKVLSDAEKRAAFDAKYEDARNQRLKALSEVSLPDGFENNQQIRDAILSILYTDRKQNPSESGVGSWRLEKLLGWPEKILEFHIWYLKEKGWIQRIDNGGYTITATGVDVVEEDGFNLGKEKLITYQRGLSKTSNDRKQNDKGY